MTLDAIVVGLLCSNLILLIALGFTISNLRSEVEYSTKQTCAEVNATREILLNILRQDMSRNHNAVMESIADIYKDIVRKGAQEPRKREGLMS